MSSTSGRRRANVRQYSAEDQALNQISVEAESRLAAKRAARAEAREIRMKEIEKQQKEAEEKEENQSTTTSNATSRVREYDTRRGSGDSTESDSTKDIKDRNYKAELREVEDKFKNAMVTSAQLDNEKQSLVYQVELLKDQFEEHEEGYLELQREYKTKSSEFELQKRTLRELSSEHSLMKSQVEYLDKLLKENGMVIITAESGEMSLEKDQSSIPSGPISTGAALLSAETIEILKKAGEGSLGTTLITNNTGNSSPTGRHAPSKLSLKEPPRPAQPVIQNLCSEKVEVKSEKEATSIKTESVISEENCDDAKVMLLALEKDTVYDEIDGRIFATPSKSLVDKTDTKTYETSSGKTQLSSSGDTSNFSCHSESNDTNMIDICMHDVDVSENHSSRESTVESNDKKGFHSDSEGDSTLDQYSEDVTDALENVLSLDDHIPISVTKLSPCDSSNSSDLPTLAVTKTKTGKHSGSEGDADEFFDAPSTPMIAPFNIESKFEPEKSNSDIVCGTLANSEIDPDFNYQKDANNSPKSGMGNDDSRSNILDENFVSSFAETTRKIKFERKKKKSKSEVENTVVTNAEMADVDPKHFSELEIQSENIEQPEPCAKSKKHKKKNKKNNTEKHATPQEVSKCTADKSGTKFKKIKNPSKEQNDAKKTENIKTEQDNSESNSNCKSVVVAQSEPPHQKSQTETSNRQSEISKTRQESQNITLSAMQSEAIVTNPSTQLSNTQNIPESQSARADLPIPEDQTSDNSKAKGGKRKGKKGKNKSKSKNKQNSVECVDVVVDAGGASVEVVADFNATQDHFQGTSDSVLGASVPGTTDSVLGANDSVPGPIDSVLGASVPGPSDSVVGASVPGPSDSVPGPSDSVLGASVQGTSDCVLGASDSVPVPSDSDLGASVPGPSDSVPGPSDSVLGASVPGLSDSVPVPSDSVLGASVQGTSDSVLGASDSVPGPIDSVLGDSVLGDSVPVPSDSVLGAGFPGNTDSVDDNFTAKNENINADVVNELNETVQSFSNIVEKEKGPDNGSHIYERTSIDEGFFVGAGVCKEVNNSEEANRVEEVDTSVLPVAETNDICKASVVDVNKSATCVVCEKSSVEISEEPDNVTAKNNVSSDSCISEVPVEEKTEELDDGEHPVELIHIKTVEEVSEKTFEEVTKRPVDNVDDKPVELVYVKTYEVRTVKTIEEIGEKHFDDDCNPESEVEPVPERNKTSEGNSISDNSTEDGIDSINSNISVENVVNRFPDCLDEPSQPAIDQIKQIDKDPDLIDQAAEMLAKLQKLKSVKKGKSKKKKTEYNTDADSKQDGGTKTDLELYSEQNPQQDIPIDINDTSGNTVDNPLEKIIMTTDLDAPGEDSITDTDSKLSEDVSAVTTDRSFTEFMITDLDAPDDLMCKEINSKLLESPEADGKTKAIMTTDLDASDDDLVFESDSNQRDLDGGASEKFNESLSVSNEEYSFDDIDDVLGEGDDVASRRQSSTVVPPTSLHLSEPSTKNTAKSPKVDKKSDKKKRDSKSISEIGIRASDSSNTKLENEKNGSEKNEKKKKGFLKTFFK